MVGVVDDQGQVTLKKITIGRDLGVSLLVTSGLQTTDRVIVNPPDSLASGDLVVAKVLPAPSKPANAGNEPTKADAKSEMKTDTKAESKSETKSESKPDAALEKLAPKDTVIAPKPSSMSQFKTDPTAAPTSPNLLAPAQQAPSSAKPAANNTTRSPS